MKLSEWAKRNGISYKTAWRWIKDGKFPVPYERTPTGTILVKAPSQTTSITAVYARVSSSDQRPDMDKQVVRLLEFANCWPING